MNKNVIKDVIISFLVSIILSLSYNISLNTIEMKNLTYTSNVIWVIFAIAFYIVIQFYRKNIKSTKRLTILSTIVSIVIAGLFTIGQLFTDYTFQNADFTLKLFEFITLKFILYFVINKYLISIAYYEMENRKEENNDKKSIKYNKKNFLIITLIIFLAYIPWLLNYYPGICSLDSLSQMLQATGFRQLSSHHPVIHTMIIKICLAIGKLINNYNTGIAIYSILQMICSAMTFSYVVLYLGKKKVSKTVQIILLLFFMFCPIIANFTITMWKDIPFALCILITTTYIIDMFTEKDFFDKKKNYILLSIFLLLDCLFRKNGLYCVALLLVVMMFIKIKNKRIVLLTILIPIIISVILTGPIYNILKIQPGDTKEAYSVFMQQFAAIRQYNSSQLTNKEKKELDRFFIDKSYIKLYDPVFADPVKRVFSEEYIKKNKAKMIKTYLKYSIKFPKTTIKAFISGNYGYFYPNIIGWEVYNRIDSRPELNIKQTPIVKLPFITRQNELLNTHNITIIGTLCSCGIYALLLIFVIGYYIYKKQLKMLPSTILIIGVELTAMLSPVFCERRYVYSIFLVTPLLLALCFSKNINKKIR